MKEQILDSSSPSSSNVPHTSKKRKAATIVGVVLAIVFGCFGGFLLASALSPKGVDYSDMNSNGYEDNVVKIYNDYLSSPKDPLFYSPNDLANIAIYKYSLQKYTSSDITASAVSMGVTQKTVGKSIRNDEEFFNESISQSSFVKVAKRFYQSQDKIDIYSGEIVNDSNGVSAQYSLEQEVSPSEYEESWGRTLDRPVIYSISSKTTLDTSQTILQDDGTYRVILDLDPLTSVLRYVKQMTQMSNLGTPPEFTKVHLEFTLDSDLNLMEMNVSESYYVWVFGKNFTESTLTEKYSIYEEGIVIPDSNEKIFY